MSASISEWTARTAEVRLGRPLRVSVLPDSPMAIRDFVPSIEFGRCIGGE